MKEECWVIGSLLFAVGIVVGMGIMPVDARTLVTKEQVEKNRVERRAIERKFERCVATCQEECVK